VPDYQVAQFHQSVYERIVRLGREFGPDAIWLPFRYDRHPDHVALSRIGFSAATVLGVRDVWEYFVYYRWKLLPGGDVRKYCRSEWLTESCIDEVAQKKRAALQCFATQTTLFFSWQTRPVLSAELIDEVCSAPEMFLLAGHAPDSEVFTAPLPLIRLIHAVEPRLKKRLDQARFLLASRFARSSVNERAATGGPRCRGA
jgi:LmbE family N-acetylglucosaminyl deacetylase